MSRSILFSSKVPLWVSPSQLGSSAFFSSVSSSSGSPVASYPHTGSIFNIFNPAAVLESFGNAWSDSNLGKRIELLIEIERTTNAMNHKCIDIRLMDAADPLLYYFLSISESDFNALKIEQNILVDFNQFPVKLIELLQACATSSVDIYPRFMAKLQCKASGSQDIVLNIVETNSFKCITHLSLVFHPAPDDVIKRHLAQLAKCYKDEAVHLKAQLSETERSLSTSIRDALDDKSKLKPDYDKPRIDFTETLHRLKLRFSQDFDIERSGLSKSLMDLIDRWEIEKQRIESSYQEKVRVLSDKVNSLEESQQVCNASLSDWSNKYLTAADQIGQLKNEIGKRTSHIRDLERQHIEYDREIAKFHAKISILDESLKEKDESLARIKGSASASVDLHARMEDMSNTYRNQISHLEKSLSQANTEITKANEIISKLQQELRNSKHKYKTKISSLEAQVKEMPDLKQHLEVAKEKLSSLQHENEEKKELIEKLEKENRERKEQYSQQEKVIEWLHKRFGQESLPFLTSLTAGRNLKPFSGSQAPVSSASQMPLNRPNSMFPSQSSGVPPDSPLAGSPGAPPPIPSPPAPTTYPKKPTSLPIPITTSSP